MKRNYLPLILFGAIVASIGVVALLLIATAEDPYDNPRDPRPYATVPAETDYPTTYPTDTLETTTMNAVALPTEALVYIEFARDLLDAGTVPEEAVTRDAVKADLVENYGLHVSDAQADEVVREILQ